MYLCSSSETACWSGPAEEFLSFAPTCREKLSYNTVKVWEREISLPGADPGHVRSVPTHAGAAGRRLQTGGGGVGVDLRQREVAETLVPAGSRGAGLGVAGLALLLQTFRGSDAGAGEGGSVGFLEMRKHEKQNNLDCFPFHASCS